MSSSPAHVVLDCLAAAKGTFPEPIPADLLHLTSFSGIVILIFVSLMASDVELFHVQMAVCMSSLEYLFRSCAHFLIGLFFLIEL